VTAPRHHSLPLPNAFVTAEEDTPRRHVLQLRGCAGRRPREATVNGTPLWQIAPAAASAWQLGAAAGGSNEPSGDEFGWCVAPLQAPTDPPGTTCGPGWGSGCIG
jgi:hypothetical protein